MVITILGFRYGMIIFQTKEGEEKMYKDFKAYKQWCKANGKKPCYMTSLQEYMKTLQKQGFYFILKIWCNQATVHESGSASHQY